MKGIILHKGKYGATRQYAGWLADALQLPAVETESVEKNMLMSYDYLLIGTSVYVGKCLVKDWLVSNLEWIRKKKLFLFVVCGTPQHETEKLQEIIDQNVPAEIRSNCQVFFLGGRVIRKNLSFKDRLLLNIGARLNKDPQVRKRMLQDVDNVKRENIKPLVDAVVSFLHVQARQKASNRLTEELSYKPKTLYISPAIESLARNNNLNN